MVEIAQHSRPLTPDQVAAIWGCSPNHVRNLIHRGELRAFRLGKRLFRIPAEALEEYEQRMTLHVSVPTKNGLGSPHADQHVADGPIVIIHSRERKSG